MTGLPVGLFTATRIPEPPIDGREWVAAEVQTDPVPAVFRAPNGQFWLTLVPRRRNTGDFVRYELVFEGRETAAIRVAELTGWVYVTPDSRYVISEPLFVLDVSAWTEYALHDALDISNHTWVQAVSHDGKRLLVARTDCPMDCPEQQVEYYEVTLP